MPSDDSPGSEPERSRALLGALLVLALGGGIAAMIAARGEPGPARVVPNAAAPALEAAAPPKGPSKPRMTKVMVIETALAKSEAPIRLVELAGGSFTMGEAGEEGERPHSVEVGAFAMCATEISAKQYEQVMGSKAVADDREDRPARMVSWFYALKFMNALTRLENRGRGPDQPKLSVCYDEATWAWDRACTGYRLPTEAEWEYAARAGSTSVYSFGDDARDICRYANVQSKACDDGIGNVGPVETATLWPNYWGLHGMTGNVWEWVYDLYDDDFGSAGALNPVNLEKGEYRVIRGGSFVSEPQDARSASRGWYWPDRPHWFLGLRCARGRHVGH